MHNRTRGFLIQSRGRDRLTQLQPHQPQRSPPGFQVIVLPQSWLYLFKVQRRQDRIELIIDTNYQSHRKIIFALSYCKEEGQ